MANQSDKTSPANRAVTFKTSFEGKPDKVPEAVAYLFDRKGALRASAPLKDGQVQLPVSDLALKGARLFIGPALPKNQAAAVPTADTMARLRAYEPAWRYVPGQRVYDLLPVPEALWPAWWWRNCRVRGRVVKPVDTGSIVYEVAVCNARVHACEVDPLILLLPRLPERDVLRLRDELLQVLERPPRPPEPDPVVSPHPPEPDPYRVAGAPVDPAGFVAQRRVAARRIVGPSLMREWAMLNPQPEPPAYVRPWMARAINPQPEPPGRVAFAALGPQPEPPDRPRSSALDALAPAVRTALTSTAVTVVREALLANTALLRPWICLWDWLRPYFYRCELKDSGYTDDHGRFDLDVWYSVLGDKPDLYFWVEYPVDGVWTTVYRPTVRCHTYWNFPCGSEVTIRVTDARVAGCWGQHEVPGKKVVVLSIGPNTGMNDINRDADAALEGTGKAGELLYYPYPFAYPEWGTKEVAFGGTLEPRLDFGTGLKSPDMYYRWSWRPLGSTDAADWKPILPEVRRHYRVLTPADAPPRYASIKIGPDEHGLFRISPDRPADAEEWPPQPINEHADLASSYFDTTAPEVFQGKFELKLELFRKVAGVPQRLDLTDEGIMLSETIGPAPFLDEEIETALPTADRRYEEEVSPGVAHLFGYRLVVHVDNRVCFGTINDVTLAGVGAGVCGFLEYDASASPEQTATLSFRASHPGNFAAFDFGTTRVASPMADLSAHQLVEASTENGFNRAPGSDTFIKTVGVSTLLAGLPCVRAAFAETLHVYALVTNGYRRMAELDAPRPWWEDDGQIGVRAFAVTPQEPAA